MSLFYVTPGLIESINGLDVLRAKMPLDLGLDEVGQLTLPR